MEQAINQFPQLADVNQAIIKATFINRLDKYVDAISNALNTETALADDADKVFFEIFYSLGWIVPILEEVAPAEEYTIKDAFVAVYGEKSDAVCMLNDFLQRFEQMLC